MSSQNPSRYQVYPLKITVNDKCLREKIGTCLISANYTVIERSQGLSYGCHQERYVVHGVMLL